MVSLYSTIEMMHGPINIRIVVLLTSFLLTSLYYTTRMTQFKVGNGVHFVSYTYLRRNISSYF